MTLPKRGEQGKLTVDRSMKAMILRVEQGLGECSVADCDAPAVATLAVGSHPAIGLCERHAADVYRGREIVTKWEV